MSNEQYQRLIDAATPDRSKSGSVTRTTVSSPWATVDPVGVFEIAVRIGVNYNRVHTWAIRGSLGEPFWRLECGSIWPWEIVQQSEPCERALGTKLWEEFRSKIPEGVRLVMFEVAQSRELPTLTSRLDRHGWGWVSVPIPDGRRLVITDSTHEGGRPASIFNFESAVEDMASLFVDGDIRKPKVGGSWKTD